MTQLTQYDKIDIEDALKKLSISNKIALLGGKVSNPLEFGRLPFLLTRFVLDRISGASKMYSIRAMSRSRLFELVTDRMEFEEETSSMVSYLSPSAPLCNLRLIHNSVLFRRTCILLPVRNWSRCFVRRRPNEPSWRRFVFASRYPNLIALKLTLLKTI